MYCPVCGTESTQGLNYCKRCGTNLTGSTNAIKSVTEMPPTRITGAAWAIALATVAVVLGGLGIIFSLAQELVRPAIVGPGPNNAAATIAGLMIVFGSITVFGTVALLIRLFSRFPGVERESQRHASRLIKRPAVADYKPAEISASAPVMPSVTEQTTRNFDPALYQERE